MYNNRISVIYFVIIFIFFNINVSARLINNKRHSVCTASLKPTTFSKKVDIPLIKNGKFDLDLIKFNDCSVSKQVKDKLNEVGTTYFLENYNIKDKNEEEIIKQIAIYINNVVRHIYLLNLYFNSRVHGYYYSKPSGLIFYCDEKFILKDHFRLFIKDDKEGKKINIDENNVIMSSKIPSGNYRQINNDYLTKIFFGDKGVKNFDLKGINLLLYSKIYKNCSFVTHKDKEDFYFDIFFDEYCPYISYDWDVEFKIPDPEVRFSFTNSNVLNTMTGIKIVAELNPLRLLESNHKFNFKFLTDVFIPFLFDTDTNNLSYSSIDATISKNDILAIFKKIYTKLKQDKNNIVSANKIVSVSDNIVENKENDKSDVDKSIKTTNTIKTPNKENLDQYSIKDLKLQYNFYKTQNDLKYKLGTSLNVEDVSTNSDFVYTLKNKWSWKFLHLGLRTSNSIKYRAFSGKKSLDPVNDPNWVYRGEIYADLHFQPGVITSLLCLTNKKKFSDFRSVNKNSTYNKCLLWSNNFMVPITYRFKDVPFMGTFFDFIVPLENSLPNRVDFSLGLGFSVMKLNISIPLLTRENSKYILSKIFKEPLNFYIN